MENKTYNGWTNYETWAVKLWMDNEEGSYNYWLDEAKQAIRHGKDKDDAIYNLSQTLKECHEEALPELKGFASDLLNAAMSEVDWREIAESLVNDYGTDEEEESNS
jgi:hypothetical protein